MERLQEQWNSRLSRRLSAAAMAVAGGVFLLIALSSLAMSVAIEIDWVEINNERVHLVLDNIPLNLAVLAAAGGLMCVSLRREPSRAGLRAMTAGMLITVTAAGAVWVSAAGARPWADSGELTRLAETLAKGSAEALAGSDYIRRFPFQLGYLLYLEGCLRLFGPENQLYAQYLNVLWLALGYYGVTRLARTLFDDARTEGATVTLLWLFLQPAFLCTFLYGSIPGMCCGVWALQWVCAFLKNGKKRLLLPAALAMGLAVTLKMNYAIWLIACCIGLLLRALGQKKLLPAVMAAAMGACALALPALIKAGYEARAEASFGKGTPQTAWLVTGVSESSLCSGWYCGYTNDLMPQSGYDEAAAAEKARADLAVELSKFQGRPRYFISFFGKKFLSQWNEPEYQAIWASEADFNRASTPDALAQNVYDGPLGRALHVFFTHQQQLVYCALALGMGFLLFQKGRSQGTLIPPLILLGAALYHLLFEAKAQYVLTYIPPALPVAAYGLSCLAKRLGAGRKRAGRS